MNEQMALSEMIERARAADAESARGLLLQIERSGPVREELLNFVASRRGRAHRVGLVGPPGSGKSTLLVHLAAHFGSRGDRVGVLSVDAGVGEHGPRLGDRLRMNELRMADNVCVHTVSVRPGGESPALLSSLGVDLLDALGYDRILVESIGLGRAQIDVVRCVHSIVLLIPPGSVEPERLLRAGVVELADLLVVNMADREGSDQFMEELRRGAGARPVGPGEWTPEVLGTVAYRGQGVDGVISALERHQRSLDQSTEGSRRQQACVRAQLAELAAEELLRRAEDDLSFQEALDTASKDVFNKVLDLSSARRRVLERFLGRALD